MWAIQPMWPMRWCARLGHVANGADVANAANVADGVLRQVAVPPRRDAAVVLWPALFATNSLEASGKGVWRATGRPENAFEIIARPGRPSLTDREENHPAFPVVKFSCIFATSVTLSRKV